MFVEQRMQREVVTVTPDMSVTGASRLLQEHRIRHLPVVENGRLAGIITDHDIRRVLPSPATSLEAYELIREPAQLRTVVLGELHGLRKGSARRGTHAPP